MQKRKARVFHAEYEQITGAVVTIFEAWMKENGVESTAASLHRLIDTLAQNRIEELRTIKVNQEEHREQIKAAFEEMEKDYGSHGENAAYYRAYGFWK